MVRQNTKREDGQNIRTGMRTENLESNNKISNAIWAEEFNEYEILFAGNSDQTKKRNRRPRAQGNNGNKKKEHR